MYEDILDMMPMEGNASDTTDPNAIENVIDRYFAERIHSEPQEMRRFHCGVYSAYISMTIHQVPWQAIRFMLAAAADWEENDFHDYSA